MRPTSRRRRPSWRATARCPAGRSRRARGAGPRGGCAAARARALQRMWGQAAGCFAAAPPTAPQAAPPLSPPAPPACANISDSVPHSPALLLLPPPSCHCAGRDRGAGPGGAVPSRPGPGTKGAHLLRARPRKGARRPALMRECGHPKQIPHFNQAPTKPARRPRQRRGRGPRTGLHGCSPHPSAPSHDAAGGRGWAHGLRQVDAHDGELRWQHAAFMPSFS